jgi:hypothetical protein
MTSRVRLAAALLFASTLAAVAQQSTLDLAGPYGNEAGCKVVRGEAKPSDEALIVRADKFEASASACDFVQVLKKGDVSIVTALCDIEGEEGRNVSFFTITPSKTDPKTLSIRDEYGAPWDEVKACQ